MWQHATRAGKTVKLLYLVPNFQNPTGSLLGLTSGRVLEWAERRDVLIVEDDPLRAAVFRRRRHGSRDQADLRRRSERSRAVSEHGVEDARARLPGRVDEGARGRSSSVSTRPSNPRTSRRGSSTSTSSTRRSVWASPIGSHHDCAISTGTSETSWHMRSAPARSRLTWPTPKGGFFIWATLPEGHTDTELLERALQHG